MTITPDTIAGLSVAQQECLGYYAFPGISATRMWPKNTLRSLVKKGLLIPHKRSLGDGGLRVVIEDYEVPLAVHVAYCEWCGELETMP